jgi:hypothetical protein
VSDYTFELADGLGKVGRFLVGLGGGHGMTAAQVGRKTCSHSFLCGHLPLAPVQKQIVSLSARRLSRLGL